MEAGVFLCLVLSDTYLSLLITVDFHLPSWSLQLYLTTSRLLYSVTGVFLVICVCVFGLVLLLQAREKVHNGDSDMHNTDSCSHVPVL